MRVHVQILKISNRQIIVQVFESFSLVFVTRAFCGMPETGRPSYKLGFVFRVRSQNAV